MRKPVSLGSKKLDSLSKLYFHVNVDVGHHVHLHVGHLVYLHVCHHVHFHVGGHVHLHVGHHVHLHVVSTLCQGSETLTEWKSPKV